MAGWRAGACVISWRCAGLALALLPWLALLAWLASASIFLTDDAFISFRYARNLLDGHGLVFNPGERVEGYTNFLWLVELAALWGAFGWRPEAAATWLSAACTVGALATMLWWIVRLQGSSRGLVAWLATGLVCSSATFAKWTSGGGLETRQFTLFAVLAVALLTVATVGRAAPRPRRARGMLCAASFCLAAASLTRPEGVLLAACCFAWHAAQSKLGGGGFWPRRSELACVAGPFLAVVASHFLFRWAYYGEWLPNTYYAKHVGAWYEAGLPYLAAAALETGLYLLLPLAALAAVWQWRRARGLALALPIVCVLSHMAYVARIGGDHFEYRPLDFYWPLLAAPAAVGLLAVGRLLARLTSKRLAPAWTLLVSVPVLLYAGVLQGALLLGGPNSGTAAGDGWSGRLALTAENAGWLRHLPGASALNDAAGALRGPLVRRKIGERTEAHGALVAGAIALWAPLEEPLRGLPPPDALMLVRGAGAMPYYLPDLKFVDELGLVDKVIARHPEDVPSEHRRMAHDRRAPYGYLAERGVNFILHKPAYTAKAGLEMARYVVPIPGRLWMPFDAFDHDWTVGRFADRGLQSRPWAATAADHVAALVAQGEHLVRGSFDVYVVHGWLVYVKMPCLPDDLLPKFFLHAVPRDVQDLPQADRASGRLNRVFNFYESDVVVIDGDVCAMRKKLPGFPLRSLATGQYYFDAEDGRLWGARANLD